MMEYSHHNCQQYFGRGADITISPYSETNIQYMNPPLCSFHYQILTAYKRLRQECDQR